MEILENAEKYAWNVAIKKVVAAILGFLASQQAITGISWLQAHGVSVQVDPAKFKETIELLGIGSFAAAHDYLKLKFPDCKYL